MAKKRNKMLEQIILSIFLLWLIAIGSYILTKEYSPKMLNPIQNATRWTNMEIISSCQYPGEKMIVFWNGTLITDMYYIDDKGHLVKHD